MPELSSASTQACRIWGPCTKLSAYGAAKQNTEAWGTSSSLPEYMQAAGSQQLFVAVHTLQTRFTSESWPDEQAACSKLATR